MLTSGVVSSVRVFGGLRSVIVVFAFAAGLVYVPCIAQVETESSTSQ
jgi:hypothetical protein